MADGEISRICSGKTISSVMHDDTSLKILMTDGHEIEILWRDHKGNFVAGTPILGKVNVRITLPPIDSLGAVGL